MIQTTTLAYSYAGGPELTFPGMACATGEHWLILGSSGSGKTTLLQLLAGLRTPSVGEVRIKDTVLNNLSGNALDQFRGRQIGIVFQESHFIRALTVEENIALAQELAGRLVDRLRIKSILERLGLGHKLQSMPGALSQGEQQRVAIARALVNEPAVLLADEPTSALDDQNATAVIDMLEELATLAQSTLIVVTHDARMKERFQKRIIL